MARRIELQGIANSLNGSFISRNNEFQGYWSIGQLKNFALRRGNNIVKISVPPQNTCVQSELLNAFAWRYTGILKHLLKKQKIPTIWFDEVNIILDFSTLAKLFQLRECVTSGDPFRCECQIIDDKGRIYSSIHYGRCLPHSPKREWQSTR